MESVQVVIVGGGVAGLAAAKTLGFTVSYILIEAQNYLGGRIQTIDAGNLDICSHNEFFSYLNQHRTSLLIW